MGHVSSHPLAPGRHNAANTTSSHPRNPSPLSATYCSLPATTSTTSLHTPSPAPSYHPLLNAYLAAFHLPRFTFPTTPFSAYPKSLPYTSQTNTYAILRHVWDNAHTSSTVRYPLNATLWTNSGANPTNPTPSPVPLPSPRSTHSPLSILFIPNVPNQTS